MLTPDYLDTFQDPLMKLYEDFIQSVMNDIARRIIKMGTVTSSAAWQMQRITESGKVYESAIKEIARLTGKSQAELKRLFHDAGVRALRFDDSIYKAAGLDPLPLNLSPAMAQVLAAGLRKTQGIVNNLTMTTAINAHKKYIDSLDLAYMQVTSGTMSYDQAIRAALKKLAAEGLSVVDYASGHTDLMDVAVRRAVLTGVQQTVGTLQTIRADEMESDLVQTSAHYGARNVGSGPMNHEGWQGKVFSRSGQDKDYPNFVTETGYGTGAGLCGWNCRHSFYPFFKGISEEIYNEHMRQALAQKKVTFKGKEYGQYEASQMQRKMERDIRKYKREAGVLGAAGMDNQFELGQVKSLQADLRQFVRETHLPRQAVREGPRAPGMVIVNPPAAPVEIPVRPIEKILPVEMPVAAESVEPDRSYVSSDRAPSESYYSERDPSGSEEDRYQNRKHKTNDAGQYPLRSSDNDDIQIRHSEKEIKHGAFDSERVTIEGNGDAILKTNVSDDEWRDLNLTEGFAKREVMSYEMDQALELNIVPKTTVFIEKGEYKSLQRWVEDAEMGGEVTEYTRERLPFPDRSEPGKMALLDMLLGNTDRHGGNWMIGDDGHLYAIDNGLMLSSIGVGQEVVDAFKRDVGQFRLVGKNEWMFGSAYTPTRKMFLQEDYKDTLEVLLESGKLKEILQQAGNTSKDQKAIDAAMKRAEHLSRFWNDYFAEDDE